MRAAVLLCAGVLLNTVAASVPWTVRRSLGLRQDDGSDGGDGEDGDSSYLAEVCYSDYLDDSAEITTPCEAFDVISSECEANGTDTIDYIAQQECICGKGSGYFDMFYGCNNCFKVHGGVENEDYYPTAAVSSASAAFCTGTPSTDFDDLIYNMLNTASVTQASGTDLFPSNTAVSDYFTGTIETQGGKITGSATLATYTGEFDSESTSADNLIPSVTAGLASGETGVTTSTTGSGTASQASSTKTTGSSNSASTSGTGASASATGNAAADLKAMSGMLSVVAAAVGVICAL